MNYKAYQNRLSQLSARFNLMVFLVFGLLLANMLLSFLVYVGWNRHTIEIIPFSGSPGYLKSARFIDRNYLILMSKNFVYERLNVSPETVDYQHEHLLSFVHPKHHAELVKQLYEESKVIKEQKISSYFNITSRRAFPDSLTVFISGTLYRYVGIKQINEEQRNYKLVFSYNSGHLHLVQFAPYKELNHV